MSKRSLLFRAAGALVRGAATLTEEVAGLVLGSDPVADRYARERRRGKRTYETAPPLRVRADMQAPSAPATTAVDDCLGSLWHEPAAEVIGAWARGSAYKGISQDAAIGVIHRKVETALYNHSTLRAFTAFTSRTPYKADITDEAVVDVEIELAELKSMSFIDYLDGLYLELLVSMVNFEHSALSRELKLAPRDTAVGASIHDVLTSVAASVPKNTTDIIVGDGVMAEMLKSGNWSSGGWECRGHETTAPPDTSFAGIRVLGGMYFLHGVRGVSGCQIIAIQDAAMAFFTCSSSSKISAKANKSKNNITISVSHTVGVRLSKTARIVSGELLKSEGTHGN